MASIINASTSGAGGVITTADASGVLQLQTAATTAVTIDASQNVGIGTASPGSRLEVSSSATSAAAGFTSTNTNAGGYSTLQLKNTGASGRTYTIALGGNTSANAGTFYVYDDTAAANRLNITSTGLLQFDSGYGSAATAYGCRAWVNFNGTGTVAIRASGNVSSITDNGTGDYTVNFATALPDANYSPNVAYSPPYGIRYASGVSLYTISVSVTEAAPTTSLFRMATADNAGGNFDPKYVSVSVFR